MGEQNFRSLWDFRMASPGVRGALWAMAIALVARCADAQTTFPSGYAIAHLDFSTSSLMSLTTDSRITQIKMSADTNNYNSNQVRPFRTRRFPCGVPRPARTPPRICTLIRRPVPVLPLGEWWMRGHVGGKCQRRQGFGVQDVSRPCSSCFGGTEARTTPRGRTCAGAEHSRPRRWEGCGPSRPPWPSDGTPRVHLPSARRYPSRQPLSPFPRVSGWAPRCGGVR
jgi:hypothetical protein